jgi:ubiquinone/menaquinone biosynthesis C-methylase UbiE
MVKYEWSQDECRNYANKMKRIAMFDHARIAKLIYRKLVLIPRLTVVDIAAGSGLLLFELGKYLNEPRLIAQDSSSEMLNIVEEEGVNYGLKPELCHCNAEEIILTDEIADVVTCKQLLHEANDPMQVLNEIYRILKRNGTGFIVDFDADGSRLAARVVKLLIRVLCGKEIAEKFRKSFSSGLKGVDIVSYLEKLNACDIEYVKMGPSYFITFKKEYC